MTSYFMTKNIEIECGTLKFACLNIYRFQTIYSFLKSQCKRIENIL